MKYAYKYVLFLSLFFTTDCGNNLYKKKGAGQGNSLQKAASLLEEHNYEEATEVLMALLPTNFRDLLNNKLNEAIELPSLARERNSKELTLDTPTTADPNAAFIAELNGLLAAINRYDLYSILEILGMLSISLSNMNIATLVSDLSATPNMPFSYMLAIFTDYAPDTERNGWLASILTDIVEFHNRYHSRFYSNGFLLNNAAINLQKFATTINALGITPDNDECQKNVLEASNTEIYYAYLAFKSGVTLLTTLNTASRSGLLDTAIAKIKEHITNIESQVILDIRSIDIRSDHIDLVNFPTTTQVKAFVAKKVCKNISEATGDFYLVDATISNPLEYFQYKNAADRADVATAASGLTPQDASILNQTTFNNLSRLYWQETQFLGQATDSPTIVKADNSTHYDYELFLDTTAPTHTLIGEIRLIKSGANTLLALFKNGVIVSDSTILYRDVSPQTVAGLLTLEDLAQ